jgi:RHS repeat-associated protein
MRRGLRNSKQVLAAGIFVVLALTAMAADKSGVSPNTISLPKGPGSIEGLGESFQPALNTGTAKYALGVRLPPGAAGHQPSLSLSYEGGGGNGPLGCGWSLDAPHIQRRTDKGIPTYGENVGFARSDVFINEMKEELVAQTNGFHFCKNEGAFIRYREVGSHWEGTWPDGTKLEFGLTAAGRIENASRVFCWLLERETDTHGNVIEYTYRSFPGEQNLNQKYLDSIRYGPGAGPWSHFHFLILQYEDRADWFEDGRAGFLVRTGKRLKSIVVGSQGAELPGHLAGDFDGDGQTDYLNRRYDLSYLNYAGTNSHWSLLERVTVVGADGLTALPPASFTYAVCNPPAELSAREQMWGGIDEPTAVMDNEFVDLVDLNADGLPDMLRTELGGAHMAFINRGPVRQSGEWGIQWSAPVEVDPGSGTAWNFDLASDRTHLADMDGDGLADLVHKSADDAVFYFGNRGRMAWTERREMTVEDSTPPAPFGELDVRTADVDFDKRIDIIQSLDFGGGTAYRIWFNLGRQKYSPPITVEPAAAFNFSVAGVQIADCNGDRVPDVARVQANGVVVIAGLGYGHFAEPKSMVLPDMTLDDAQVAKARLTDLNGDGLADLVMERASPGTCWYWLNLGNYTFSPRKTIVDLPTTISQDAAVRWADLNGNGTVDLVYADSQATPRLQAIDVGELLTGGLPPNTLTRIENGIGRVTRIEYAPSTRFALEDAAAGRPWGDPLPFPVTVVSKVSTSDSLGHEYVTQFQYHDGYYDSGEKQFRGFAEVEQIEMGDASAPTLVSRSRFDTGRNFEAMKGRLLRLSTETAEGGIFSDETTTWASPPRTLMVGTNGEAVRYAHPIASVKVIRELGQGTGRRVETESEYDNYGNLIRFANYGIVEGTNRAAFNDERITTTEFALNLSGWLIRQPKRQEIQDENGAVISRSESFYDDESFSGNNFGEVTIGNLTLRREWITPSNPSAFIKATRTKYDVHGNPIALFDPLSDGKGNAGEGHYRELTYDGGFHSYPTRETIHVGGGKPDLAFQAAYDEGLGTVTSSTDFNGNTTAFGYDALGRLIRIIKPGGTPAYPTAEYEYALGVRCAIRPGTGEVDGIVNYVEARQLDRAEESAGSKRDHYMISRAFVDGLGRPLMTRSEAEPAPGQMTPRVVVRGAVQFNARQKVARTLNPFFTLQSGSLEEMLAFENIETAGWGGQFHENGSLVTLELAGAHASSVEYDALLRAVRTVNADGTSSRTVFEPLAMRVFDENDTDPGSPHFNTPVLQVQDGLGRMIQVDEIVRLNDDGTPSGSPKTWTTRLEYDLNDALIRITDSQNNVKVMQYDGLKRKTAMNDPDAGMCANTYDDASNLIETVDAKSQRITYTYDGANRLLSEDFHDENSTEFSYHRSPDVAYFYDEPAATVDPGDGTRSTAGNTKGALAYVLDATGEEHTSFDARGRVEWTVKRIFDPVLEPRPTTLVSYTTRFKYDSMDRVTRMIYPDNDQVSYEYNDRGLLRRIVGGPSGDIVPAISYLPSAQQDRVEYGNGVLTTYQYDRRQRLTTLLTHQASRVAEPLIHFRYELDGASNIRAIEDQRPTSVISAADPRRNSQNFAYDDLYRLTRVDYNPSPPQPSTNFISYRYDRIGNMLAQTSDISHLEKGLSVTDPGNMSYGGASGPANRVGRAPSDPPGPHALSSVQHSALATRSFPYDANGNMTCIDGLKCIWDFKDRLVAVEDETMRAEYRYDFTGRRIIKRVWPKPVTNSQPATPNLESSAVTYPGRYFEVREHDEPTKYVFNGATRVAHVVGSLSTNERIQRVRLRTGPNLIALAVTAANLAGQLRTELAGSGTVIKGLYRWSEITGGYVSVNDGQTVEAGSVLWINAVTNAVCGVVGSYAEPEPRAFWTAGYVAGPGLETWSPTFPAWSGIWTYSAADRRWQARLPDGLLPVSELPQVFPPGQVLYVTGGERTEFAISDPTLRIRYYHPDHLGSSSIMTDAEGALVNETAFYPFGIARHEHRLREVEECYKFTQKERDRESGLQYFEARYLAGPFGRLASVDPKYANPDTLSGEEMGAFLSTPQKNNLYAYVSSNPLNYSDPTGLDEKKEPGLVDTVDTASSRLGFLADVNGLKGPGVAFSAISLTIKTAQFIDNPTVPRAGVVVYEGTKTALTSYVPPIGLALQGLDLVGIGPGTFFNWAADAYDEVEANIKEKDEIIASYKKISQETAQLSEKIRAETVQIQAVTRKMEKRIQETDDLIKQLDERIKVSNELLKKVRQRR